MSEFTTPNGKKVATYVEPGTSMFKVKFIPGGELPVELSGLYTSSNFADRAIQAYIAKQEKPKGKSDKEL